MGKQQRTLTILAGTDPRLPEQVLASNGVDQCDLVWCEPVSGPARLLDFVPLARPPLDTSFSLEEARLFFRIGAVHLSRRPGGGSDWCAFWEGKKVPGWLTSLAFPQAPVDHQKATSFRIHEERVYLLADRDRSRYGVNWVAPEATVTRIDYWNSGRRPFWRLLTLGGDP